MLRPNVRLKEAVTLRAWEPADLMPGKLEPWGWLLCPMPLSHSEGRVVTYGM